MSEDMRLWAGVGWVNSGAGVAVGPDGVAVELGTQSTRSMQSEDVRERMAARQAQEAQAARVDLLESQVRAGLVSAPVTLAEKFGEWSRRADLEDRRAARLAEQELDRVRFGQVDLVPIIPPQRARHRAARREVEALRAESAVRDVKGAELDQLRQEITQLRSLLAAHGIRPRSA